MERSTKALSPSEFVLAHSGRHFGALLRATRHLFAPFDSHLTLTQRISLGVRQKALDVVACRDHAASRCLPHHLLRRVNWCAEFGRVVGCRTTAATERRAQSGLGWVQRFQPLLLRCLLVDFALHVAHLHGAVLLLECCISLLSLTILRIRVPHQPGDAAAPQAVDRLAALGVGRVAEDAGQQALPFRGLDER